MGRREFSREEKDLIIKLYLDGNTINDIKKIVHSSFEKIKAFLNENNVQRDRLVWNKREFSDADITRILQLYYDMVSIEDIMKEFGCSYKTLKPILDGITDKRDCIRKGVSASWNLITNDEFLIKLSKVNSDIEPLEKYINTATPILMRCRKCGHVWPVRPHNVLHGHGCPVCAGVIRYTQETFVAKIAEVNPDIEVVGKYNGMRERILCRCKIDGTTWNPLALHLVQGGGCPTCKESRGEREIRKYLESNNIVFLPQHKFDDCRNIRPLPFDFYIQKYNTCIEYDGQQHFSSISIFGGEEQFKQTQINDNIKNCYCAEHNIKLVRIPYWDVNNIANILNVSLAVQN